VFWNATPREFYCALQGQWDVEQNRQQQEWERSRWHAWITVRPHITKDISQTDLIEFPWEKSQRPPVEIPTDEDIQRIIERDKKILNG
jgi:hypothetical protein